MNRKILLFLIIVFVAFATGGFIKHFHLNRSLLHGGVIRFGHLTLGGEAPIGPGSATFAPELYIPPSKFYIGLAQENLWCVFEECSPLGGKVAALGGWLQSENTKQPTVADDFGLSENPLVASVIVVGDETGKIIGIYPKKNITNLSSLLHIHRNLWQ